MDPSFCSAIVAPMSSSTSASSSIRGRKSCSMASPSVCLCFVVDLVPFRSQFMCPFAVADDSGRNFCTCADVIGEKPTNWLLSIALQKVSMVGENMHW